MSRLTMRLEAQLRMTRMYEEYQRRTAGLRRGTGEGQVSVLSVSPGERLLRRRRASPKSGGVYMEGPEGTRLMAIAGKRTDGDTWNTVCSMKAFSQFAAATIKYRLPEPG